MHSVVVSISIAIVLLFVQAAAQPTPKPLSAQLAASAGDFPRPQVLTMGNLPVIFHAQGFWAQEQEWREQGPVPSIEYPEVMPAWRS
jgi:hypothetical protein